MTAPTVTTPAVVTPAGTPSATATVTVADLTLTSSRILTNGSNATVSGTAKVTVRNAGSTAPRLTLTFRGVPVEITLIGDAWTTCDKTDDGSTRTVTCPVGPVAAGSSTVAAYDFRIDFLTLGSRMRVGTVTVTAVDAQERDISDNTAELEICTNGCF